MSVRGMLQPDFVHYEGVRPINIWALRILFFLMAVFVAPRAWMTIARHEGPWDPYRAVAFAVWAIYPTMSILGVFRPLRFLPIMLFMIGYKGLWLVIVAYPLWRAGQLDGAVATMAIAFISAPIGALIVPWRYVWRAYVSTPVGPATSPLSATST